MWLLQFSCDVPFIAALLRFRTQRSTGAFKRKKQVIRFGRGGWPVIPERELSHPRQVIFLTLPIRFGSLDDTANNWGKSSVWPLRYRRHCRTLKSKIFRATDVIPVDEQVYFSNRIDTLHSRFFCSLSRTNKTGLTVVEFNGKNSDEPTKILLLFSPHRTTIFGKTWDWRRSSRHCRLFLLISKLNINAEGDFYCRPLTTRAMIKELKTR